MSGETRSDVSSWTTDTLKEYTDRRLEDVERSIEVALNAHDNLVNTQIDAMNNTINKDRDSYKQRFDASQTAIDKSEQASEKRFESVNEFRKTLSDQTNSFLPRVEYQAHHSALVDRVTELNDRMNRSEGQASGSQVTTSKLYASIAAVGTIIGIIVLLANGVF